MSAQRFLGVPVEAHAHREQPNDEVFRRAREGVAEGLVVIAEHQTQGRGRLGRSWFDAAGRSLLFSVLLKPAVPLQSYPLLALVLASSVADAGTEAAGETLAVKWPNDVVHRGRKLCGVLAESRSLAPGKPPVLVLGAGVNVNQLEEDFPPEIRGRATSLRIAAGGRAFAIPEFLAAVLARFERDVALARRDDPRPLFERVRPRLPAPGAQVRVALGERTVEGEVTEGTETGALRVRDRASGRGEPLAAGVLE